MRPVRHGLQEGPGTHFPIAPCPTACLASFKGRVEAQSRNLAPSNALTLGCGMYYSNSSAEGQEQSQPPQCCQTVCLMPCASRDMFSQPESLCIQNLVQLTYNASSTDEFRTQASHADSCQAIGGTANQSDWAIQNQQPPCFQLVFA